MSISVSNIVIIVLYKKIFVGATIKTSSIRISQVPTLLTNLVQKLTRERKLLKKLRHEKLSLD